MFTYSTQNNIINAIKTNNWKAQVNPLYLIAFPATGALDINLSLTRVARELSSKVDLKFLDCEIEQNARFVYLTRNTTEVCERLWYSVPNGYNPIFKEDRDSSETIEEFTQKTEIKLNEFDDLVNTQLNFNNGLRVTYADYVLNPDDFMIGLCNFLFK